ncbi:hypothetical protein BASA81_014309 [Batrachochytrium salamandrivorans]|nr:hypothetical protein BASA81_014309 [Batrachochytrium salamandrivorans]
MMLSRLGETVNMQNQLVGADDRRVHCEFQANLCSVLTSSIRRLQGQISEVADAIMTTMLLVMSSASKVSTLMEDAFLVAGALATAIEGNFVRYMDSFFPYLNDALQNFEEHQLCTIAVGLVGDILPCSERSNSALLRWSYEHSWRSSPESQRSSQY